MCALLRRIWQGLPLFLIPLGIYTQQFYVSMSEGNGIGYVEIPTGSRDHLIDDLNRIGRTVTTPAVVTDSSNPSLFKLEAAYVEGRRFLIPSTDYFPTTSKTGSLFVKRDFDLRAGTAPAHTNPFEQDQTTERMVNKNDATLLLSSNSQTVLNRSRYPDELNHVILPMRWKDAENLLIFIHSDRGPSMNTRRIANRPAISRRSWTGSQNLLSSR